MEEGAMVEQRAEEPVVQVELVHPSKFVAWMKPKRYKVAYGGRGSGKSWTVAQLLLVSALQRRRRIVCAREIQASLRESLIHLLAAQIERLGLGAWFAVSQTQIKCVNGSEFVFAGLRSNVDSIKSMEGIDIAWVEEAQNVSARSWEVLIPTVRKEGSEIWVTFNPDLPEQDTYQRFVATMSEDVHLVQINWDDNPHFPAVLDAERRKMQRSNPALYAHIWEGGFLADGDKQIWHEGHFAYYEHLPPLVRVEIVVDTAAETRASSDYSVFTVMGVDGAGRLYVLDCVYGKWVIQDLVAQAYAVWDQYALGVDEGVEAAVALPWADINVPAALMAIEDASSGKQLCQVLESDGVVTVARIVRGRRSGLGLSGRGDGAQQETRKWKRSSQAQLHMDSVDEPIYLPHDAQWLAEFKRQMLSIQRLHCGSEAGLAERGTWDIPDTVADGVWRLKIARVQAGVSLYAGM